MARAIIFPGQGSQAVGMGADLAEAFPVARAVFEEVDEALERPLSQIMWDGPSDKLTRTDNAQPALMAHSIAMLRVLETEAGFDIADAAFVAGHSLGEYSALCAAGAISLKETARLLRTRGEAMQRASEENDGAMAALIGVDVEGAQKAIDAAPVAAAAPSAPSANGNDDGDGDSNSKAGVCVIANDNAPGQVVISGACARVEAVAAGAKEHGAKMAKLLAVAGAFHSPLMASAAEAMQAALKTAKISAPKIPLYANVTAAQTHDPESIRKLLVDQVTGRVRWTQSIQAMTAAGCDAFIEVGSGKVLAGLIKRIDKEASAISVGAPGDLDAFAKF